jgi:hypothetical protein
LNPNESGSNGPSNGAYQKQENSSVCYFCKPLPQSKTLARNPVNASHLMATVFLKTL